MRIHLVCSAGMSTSLLVNNMKKSAPADYVIDAGPFAALEEIVDEMLAILSDRNRIMQKHDLEETNARWNEYLNG